LLGAVLGRQALLRRFGSPWLESFGMPTRVIGPRFIRPTAGNPVSPDALVRLRVARPERTVLPSSLDSDLLTPASSNAKSTDLLLAVPAESNEVTLESDQDVGALNLEATGPTWSPEDAQQLLEMEQRLEALDVAEPGSDAVNSRATNSDTLEVLNSNTLEPDQTEMLAVNNLAAPEVANTDVREIANLSVLAASNKLEVTGNLRPDDHEQPEDTGAIPVIAPPLPKAAQANESSEARPVSPQDVAMPKMGTSSVEAVAQPSQDLGSPELRRMIERAVSVDPIVQPVFEPSLSLALETGSPSAASDLIAETHGDDPIPTEFHDVTEPSELEKPTQTRLEIFEVQSPNLPPAVDVPAISNVGAESASGVSAVPVTDQQSPVVQRLDSYGAVDRTRATPTLEPVTAPEMPESRLLENTVASPIQDAQEEVANASNFVREVAANVTADVTAFEQIRPERPIPDQRDVVKGAVTGTPEVDAEDLESKPSVGKDASISDRGDLEVSGNENIPVQSTVERVTPTEQKPELAATSESVAPEQSVLEQPALEQTVLEQPVLEQLVSKPITERSIVESEEQVLEIEEAWLAEPALLEPDALMATPVLEHQQVFVEHRVAQDVDPNIEREPCCGGSTARGAVRAIRAIDLNSVGFFSTRCSRG
jgi:hypothetical protein